MPDTEILTLHVTADQLKSLGAQAKLKPLFDGLPSGGTLRAVLDEHGCLHIRFTSDTLGTIPEIRRPLETKDLNLLIEVIPKVVTEVTREEAQRFGADQIAEATLSEPSRPLSSKWSCYEVIPGTPEWDESEARLNTRRWRETDVADRFRQADKPDTSDGSGFTTIPVLEFLNGRPWDNIAYNVVQSVRPSTLKVQRHNATEKGSSLWAVTVYLDDDDRTIHKISQQVTVGLTGCRHGWDVDCYIRCVEPPARTPSMIVNPKAVNTLLGRTG